MEAKTITQDKKRKLIFCGLMLVIWSHIQLWKTKKTNENIRRDETDNYIKSKKNQSKIGNYMQMLFSEGLMRCMGEMIAFILSEDCDFKSF